MHLHPYRDPFKRWHQLGTAVPQFMSSSVFQRERARHRTLAYATWSDMHLNAVMCIRHAPRPAYPTLPPGRICIWTPSCASGTLLALHILLCHLVGYAFERRHVHQARSCPCISNRFGTGT